MAECWLCDMWFDHAKDPVMAFAGWSATEGRAVLEYEIIMKPFVLQVLGAMFALCFCSYFVLGALAPGWVLSDKAHSDRSEVVKESALCFAGIVIHSYMGLKAACTAWMMRDMPFALAVANREAVAAAPEAMGHLNAAGVLGEIFLAYILYVTVMWTLGWEKGMDKGIHHVVFFFLAMLLAGWSFCHRLAVFAIAMELSTVPLNINLWAGWMKHWKLTHLIFGALFVLCFFFVRIFFYGYGLATTLSGAAEHGVGVVPVADELVYLVLFLFTGGWLLQVFWLKTIYEKVTASLGKKKTE
eukprot:TRINITY_DN1790_c0_g3_i1.p1 TRINITY_DN1790_c0_g3~~TRINITY_DN1790_c0_g3_i1.p1  ORF type:complete len:314 (+),score=123.41 TRINITY_DN1790_c0_g3_i1:46-942(+)